ncbi:MAG: T9SS type A sorting domain-containing protein [Candidatus Kapabacteria bacterium]|nr:T9SS type A sorting domain-containing protein [Candidatus Kapabacteria bacterium]
MNTSVFAQMSAPLTSDFTPPRGNAPSSPSESPGYFRLITATSSDGLTFTSTGKILSDQANVADMIVDARGRWYVYYTGWTVGTQQNATALAISDDKGQTWYYKYVRFTGLPNATSKPADPDIILLPDGTFRMYATTDIAPGGKIGIIYAESTDGITFEYKGTVASLPNAALIDSNTFLLGDSWYMYAIGTTATTHFRFTSKDGKTFTPAGELRLNGVGGGGDYFASNGYTTSDGRYRMFASFLPEKHVRSFITADGSNWTLESGNRMTFSGVQPEELYLKDPAVMRLSDGTYFAVVTTRLTQSATVFAPRITNVTPLTGNAGTTITITGENFTGATSVLVGGVPVTSFIVISPTQITATVPSRASGAIAVLTSRGSATSTSAFMGISTGISDNTQSDNTHSAQFQLFVSPNPAQNLICVKFTLSKSERVSLKVFNALGQEVAQILDVEMGAGTHEKSLDINRWSLGQGIYFLQLQTNNQNLQTIPLQVQ